MSEVKTRFKNLFKIHRFTYHYHLAVGGNTGTVTVDGSNIGGVRDEFIRMVDELALSGVPGDSITFTVTKEKY